MLKKRKRAESEESKKNGAEGEEEDEEGTQNSGRGVFRQLDKTDKDMVNVEFELVTPSEAYYHSVRALLT